METRAQESNGTASERDSIRGRIVFTMGLPGSGKSTLARAAFPGYGTIDPDAFKASHPAYDPKRPEALHEWSKARAAEAYALALASGGNWIVDGTGRTTAKLADRMAQARALGFDVTLFYVSVPLAVAIERNAKRERTVPVEYVRTVWLALESGLPAAIAAADRFITVDNSTERQG